MTHDAHDHRELLQQIATAGDGRLRPAAGLLARGDRAGRGRGGAGSGGVRRAARLRRCATCATCRGARSTTTTRATSTSCRCPSRRPGGATRILVAIADVDALVAAGCPIDDHARHNTTSVYTPAVIFPMLPERLSTDLTSLAFGEERARRRRRHGHRRRRADDRASTSTRRSWSTAPSWPTAASPPGSRARVRCPRRWPAVPGLDEQLRAQDAVAQRLRQVAARARRARLPDDRGAAGLRRQRGARPRGGARQPRTRPDRGLHDRRQRRDRAVPRGEGLSRRSAASSDRRSAGIAWRRSRRSTASACPPTPIRRRWPTSSRPGGPPTRCASRTCRSRSSSCSAPASTSSTARARTAAATSAWR